MKRSFTLIAMLLIFVMTSAQQCQQKPPPGEIESLPGKTLTGSGYPSSSNTKGIKRIRLGVKLADGYKLNPESVSVVYYRTKSDIKEVAASSIQGVANIYYADLPGSEELDYCEVIFYRWKFEYENFKAAKKQTYVMPEMYVMPDVESVAKHTVKQHFCETPKSK